MNNELKQKLQALLQAGDSGMVYVNTQDGQAGIVSFENGTLVGVVTGTLRGNDALEYLAGVEQLSYRFQPGNIRLPGSEPNPETVSRVLGLQNTRATSIPTPSGQSSAQALSPLQTQVFAMITAQMTEFAGPIAGMLVDEAKQSNATSMDGSDNFEGILRQLAGEIVDAQEAQRFLQNTRAELSRLSGVKGTEQDNTLTTNDNTLTTNAAAAGKQAPSPLQTQVFAMITAQMTEFAGPIAGMLVDEAKQSNATSMDGSDNFEGILRQLAGEIVDAQEAQRFLQNTRAELSRLSGY